MIVEWKKPETEKPPRGEPLIVTVKCAWKAFQETIGPVYLLRDPATWRWVYWDGDRNSLIGPDDVKIIAWDYWPAPVEETDA